MQVLTAKRNKPKIPSIYFICHEINGPIKIGFSSNFKERKKGLNTLSPREIKIIKVCYGGTQFAERLIHKKFNKIKINREWFENCEELRNFIKKIPKSTSEYEIIKILHSFEFNTITKTKDSKLFLDLKLEYINDILNKAQINSKNSGFYQGIEFAKRILNQNLKDC